MKRSIDLTPVLNSIIDNNQDVPGSITDGMNSRFDDQTYSQTINIQVK
jgi:hypothetical protein